MVDDFIRVDGISKRFGSVTAVDDVTLGIGRGEFFSLLGPSGCGKTTLLRMIAGFEYPTQGEIYVDGKPMTDLPANKRPSNMVFQSYAIFPHLNVADNIAYGLRTLNLSRGETKQRVEQALAMIKLEGFEDRKADQLSGGQRQRVALARALVRRPKVLLLDEPLGALDKRLREAMQIELRQLQREVGVTFVFVTHDQEEALSLSDRIAVMSMGRILQVADPRSLYERPNSRDVADFIGTMNFLEGRLLRREGSRVFIDAGPAGQFDAVLPDGFGDDRPGASVLAAIRPEKITLSAPSDGTMGLSGAIVARAYLGERSHFHVAVQGIKEPFSVAAQNAGSGQTAPALKVGASVTLRWPADAVVILPNQ